MFGPPERRARTNKNEQLPYTVNLFRVTQGRIQILRIINIDSIIHKLFIKNMFKN
jgi:hypothetical protein